MCDGVKGQGEHTLVVLLVESVVSALLLIHGAIRRAHEDGVIGMGLDVLLQVLWSLERLAAEIALVRLEWDMYAHV